MSELVELPGTDAHTVVSQTDPDKGVLEAGPGVSQGGPTPPLPFSKLPLPHPVPLDSLNSCSLASLDHEGIHGTVLQLATVGSQWNHPFHT